MMRIIRITVLLLAAFLPELSLAEEYDATVTTSNGSYTVPVEVEGGEVTEVHWPNGGNMNVYGAGICGGSASGTNSRGDTVDIEIDGYQEASEG